LFPRRLASAPRFFVLLLVVHIIPPNSSESYVIFYGARTSARRRFIGGGPRLFRLLLRVSPVAQHIPEGAVREARDSLEEVEFGRLPHRPLQIERPRLRSQALEEEAVGPFFASADE
jgi:hypothetical protein